MNILFVVAESKPAAGARQRGPSGGRKVRGGEGCAPPRSSRPRPPFAAHTLVHAHTRVARSAGRARFSLFFPRRTGRATGAAGRARARRPRPTALYTRAAAAAAGRPGRRRWYQPNGDPAAAAAAPPSPSPIHPADENQYRSIHCASPPPPPPRRNNAA